MLNKQRLDRPFFLTITLIVLSVIAIIFNGLLIYTGIYYVEAQRGLETYLAETFVKYPFVYIYAILSFASLILLVSVILMWMRKKAGLYLYFFWSFVVMLLLLFGEQTDWFNILVIMVILYILFQNSAYFSINLGALSDDSDDDPL